MTLTTLAGGRPARMGEVQVWDVAKRKLALSVPVTYDTVYGASWSPDGTKIAFGCADNTVRAINAKTGEQVYQMYLDGRLQEINDYCLCDTLDTYFVFLRTRILTGDINIDQETELVAKARELLESKAGEFPVLRRYLDNWTEFPSP